MSKANNSIADDYGLNTPIPEGIDANSYRNLIASLSSKTPGGLNKPVYGPGSTFGQQVSDAGIGKPGADVQSPLSTLLGNLGAGVSILGDLSSIYQGFQQNRLAKANHKAQLGFANANLGNSVKSYNNQYADVLNARGFTQGDNPSHTAAAITAGSLNFKPIKG